MLALENYTRAIVADPDFAKAYCYRGLMFQFQGEFELAMADYNRALELEPEYVCVHQTRPDV